MRQHKPLTPTDRQRVRLSDAWLFLGRQRRAVHQVAPCVMKGDYANALRMARLTKLDLEQFMEMLGALATNQASAEPESVTVVGIEPSHVTVCAESRHPQKYVVETVNIWFERAGAYAPVSVAPTPCPLHPNRRHWRLSDHETPPALSLLVTMEATVKTILYTGLYDPLPFGPKTQLSRDDVRQIHRERIYRSLAEGLRQHSYHNLTVQHILGLAGIGRRTFYEHFSSKEDCLLSAYTVVRSMRERVSAT